MSENSKPAKFRAKVAEITYIAMLNAKFRPDLGSIQPNTNTLS